MATLDRTEAMPTIDKCIGCAHVDATYYCDAYLFPEFKWLSGRTCPLATHPKKEEKKTGKQIDPLKASKRQARGK
ncbi:MAG: PxxKW family cysteine-rich protein [Candidatus Methanoperedens sp.]|nr:PxxKW family cysteine-rich protein [Candidatus Methanoperedens sp.]